MTRGMRDDDGVGMLIDITSDYDAARERLMGVAGWGGNPVIRAISRGCGCVRLVDGRSLGWGEDVPVFCIRTIYAVG